MKHIIYFTEKISKDTTKKFDLFLYANNYSEGKIRRKHEFN